MSFSFIQDEVDGVLHSDRKTRFQKGELGKPDQ